MNSPNHQKAKRLGLRTHKPETLLKTKMTKLKLSHFEYIMKSQGILENTVMLGKTEGSGKRGRPNTRWTDSVKKAIGMSLQELSGDVEDRTLQTKLIRKVARSQNQLNIT